MKDLTTQHPPVLRRVDGGMVITTTFELDGEVYAVSASVGDGRYHAQRVHDLIIGPALGWHPLDGARPLAPVDVSDI